MTANVPATSPAAQAPTNVLSVVAFVLSLLGFNVIAIILGAIGLSQVKKTGERGRGFALAAIWIGVISIVLFVILIVSISVFAAARVSAIG
ncbi:DUF4190 domain-containing protein [Microbacterium sp.]|uniref:DUF4190 domain-containing protein n=1 Tax=Microbacterium sp. TaxID=51671 RepID=UPI002BB8699C|nr:DUF4190 domain-containing protein [Microbacterium sp.]HWL78596.1 DUF4190 domain-containing protein [Microbacterium sp.]